MAADFDTLMTEATGKIAAALAESLTHTAVDSTVTAVTGTFAEADPRNEPQPDGQVRIRRATATIADADLPAGTDPAPGETITRDGQVWTIRTVKAAGGGEYWQLELTRSEPTEKSREPYRLRR